VRVRPRVPEQQRHSIRPRPHPGSDFSDPLTQHILTVHLQHAVSSLESCSLCRWSWFHPTDPGVRVPFASGEVEAAGTRCRSHNITEPHAGAVMLIALRFGSYRFHHCKRRWCDFTEVLSCWWCCCSVEICRISGSLHDEASKQSNSVAFSPQVNYTVWVIAAGRWILVPNFTDRRVSRGQRGGHPRPLISIF
jgi:hypothetical protein